MDTNEHLLLLITPFPLPVEVTLCAFIRWHLQHTHSSTNTPNYTHIREVVYLEADGSAALVVVCVFTPADNLSGLLSVMSGLCENCYTP